jgi:glycosyltransferase involved in cell wall biosynthesis
MLNYFFEGYIAISKNCAITANEIVGQSPTIIFNGVDTSRILTNVRRGQSSGPWKIIAVGRIGPQKNFSLLVEALALLELLIDDDYIVEVAGPGTPKDLAAIEAQAEKAGIAHRVCFLGTVADVANLMKSSDLLVMSSAWEGLPIVLLEAVTARLPFIATDVGGCGEIVEMTGAGLIVPVNDADALAKAILELLTEHSRRDEMRDAAANCSALFSIERSAADHLELYKQTVRSRL